MLSSSAASVVGIPDHRWPRFARCTMPVDSSRSSNRDIIAPRRRRCGSGSSRAMSRHGGQRNMKAEAARAGRPHGTPRTRSSRWCARRSRRSSATRSRRSCALLRAGRPRGPGRAAAGRPVRRRAVALELRAQARAGTARVRVFNPTIEEHGWQSTHTIIEIVNDDMPFLVDSVTMEVNRHGLTLHLIIHPLVAVQPRWRRHAAGTGATDDGGARRESFIHVEVDRVTDPARAGGAGRRRRARARRRAPGGGRLEDDAGATARDRRRPRGASAADSRRGARRRPGLPALARRQPLHVPRLPLARTGRRSTARTR